MSLKFNADEARKADKTSSVIRETGKYVGVITRAEKLLSRNNVQGVGFSFKTDDGYTANYLDVYTVKANGEELWGVNLVNAVLCCARLKDVAEGEITFEKWDAEVREMAPTKAAGYPALMGKRIGFVLQRELGTNTNNGAETDKVVLVRVFEASSGLTSTEILDGKTKGVKLDEFMKTLLPVRDNRKKTNVAPLRTGVETTPEWVDDDITGLKF